MIRITKIAERFFTNMREIPSSGVILSEEVRKLCRQNVCGFYGKNWTCPPAVESLNAIQEKLGHYEIMLIVYKVHGIKNSFDWEGMKAGVIEFKDSLLSLLI